MHICARGFQRVNNAVAIVNYIVYLSVLVSHVDGCPLSQDGVWYIIWADTERGATDTQPCPGVDTIGIIIAQTITMHVAL